MISVVASRARHRFFVLVLFSLRKVLLALELRLVAAFLPGQRSLALVLEHRSVQVSQQRHHAQALLAPLRDLAHARVARRVDAAELRRRRQRLDDVLTFEFVAFDLQVLEVWQQSEFFYRFRIGQRVLVHI